MVVHGFHDDEFPFDLMIVEKVGSFRKTAPTIP